MPRIAPEQLIKCLAILLTPGGGIKSTDEVARLVLLMQRFSKKLVSKCVYVSILKNTELGLLSDFMQHGGWALVFIWLEKAIDAQNQFFIQEILDLLMICPVDVTRLKSNNIPKLVKSLSKGNQLGGGVQDLAANIVAKWLAIVKGVTTSAEAPVVASTSSAEPIPSPPMEALKAEEAPPLPVLKLTLKKKDGKKRVRTNSSQDEESEGACSDHSDAKSEETHEKSKSSSSSHKESDRKHRSESRHKSDSRDKHRSSSDKSKSSREKERERSSKSSSSSKSYMREREREREKEKTKKKEKEKDEKLTKLEKDRQLETDQATLARLMGPSINKLGKIPKKTDKAKLSELKESSGKVEPEKKEKPVAPAPPPEIPKKNISFSIEKRLPSDQKPKTVKTFNAKPRSTGLEEESAKPPPSRSKSSSAAPAAPPSKSSSTASEKKPVKRSSPSKEQPADKKLKSEHGHAGSVSPTEKAKPSMPAPKPKVMILQESDVFSSALNDALLLKETKKKKRKLSKDTKDETKETKVASPTAQRPEESKPTFKFYRDTLDSTLEESKKRAAAAETEATTSDTEHEEGPQNETPPGSPTGADSSSPSRRKSPEKCSIELVSRPPDRPLKGALSYLKTPKRPKRSVHFKSVEDGLEDVFYFELDETERCNVSRPNSFTDMRSMERELERENFHIARKLTQEDVQAERTAWTALIPVDVGKAAIVDAGKNSREKEIQKARQMIVKPAIYGGYNVIPPSPAEPDLEVHATTDPALMPAEDSSAESSTFDYSTLPWPEPLPAEACFYTPPTGPPANMMGPPANMMGGPPMGMIPPGMFPPGGPPGPTPFGAPNGNNWMGGPGDMPPMGGPMPPNMPFPPGMAPPGMGPPMGMNMPMMGGPPMPPEMMMGGPPGFPPMGPPGMFAPGGPPGFNGPPGPWFGPGGQPDQGPGGPVSMEMNEGSSRGNGPPPSSRSKSSGGSWHRGGGEPSKPGRDRDKRGRPRGTIPCRHKKFCKTRDCPYMHPSSR